MDHLDWMHTPQHEEYASALAEQVMPGGIVIWRSAALHPPYADIIAKAGFDVKCISRADQGYMDKCVLGLFRCCGFSCRTDDWDWGLCPAGRAGRHALLPRCSHLVLTT